MGYLLLSKKNAEAIIDDNCGISKFYAVANLLQRDLNITFLNQVDDVELLNWDFTYKNKFLTLHYDVYGGVSIKEAVAQKQQSLMCEELGNFIHSKVY